MKKFTIFLALAWPLTLPADEPPLSPEEVAKAEVGVLELDAMEVTGTLSVQQQAALRIVRQALEQPVSYRRADFDKWRCWFEKPIGTRLTYLHCARNGDLWALKPRGEGGMISANDLNPIRYGDYGQVLVSSRPMNEPKVRKMLENLAGSADNDQQFIDMVLKGERPPRDVPSETELDRFARALSAIDVMDAQGVDEDTQISAIEGEGLTLERYNRIATLVEAHPSIRDEIAARLDR